MKKEGDRSWEIRQQDIQLRIIVGILACICLLAAVGLSSIALNYKEGSDEYIDLAQTVLDEERIIESEVSDSGTMEGTSAQQTESQSVDFEKLWQLNPDAVGWITFDHSTINYPIVQGQDNRYYLSHTFLEYENEAGCIFMDFENAKDFSDRNTFIYGHNLKTGAMFAQLNHYRKEDYYAANNYFWILTPDGTYKYEIFSCYVTEDDSDSYQILYQDKQAYCDYLTKIKNRSLYDTGVAVTGRNVIVTLSTCTSSEGEHFIVHAIRIEE
ncbi:MAG: class B sortase [Lachnospiraceae bacterium]